MTQQMYYRPPSEEESFIVPVMRGCSHNKCAFCNTYRGIVCKALPLEEIVATMEADAAELGPERLDLVQSVYLEGGDPMFLKTERLLAIMREAKRVFPRVNRFACYATARQTVKKSAEELRALAEAGLRRVFVGLESGSDAVLERTNKGCDSSDILEAGKKLASAGIELDVSMMLGIGGREDSQEHATATARLINALAPQCIRILTFSPKRDTEMGDDYLAGKFALMSPHETIRELKHLISQIDAPTQLVSDHWTNFVLFKAAMPAAKDALLAYIDKHLELPETSFRQVGIDEARG